MFEKEAEEYWYDSGSNEFDIGQVEKACKQSFKDGAIFGYNKANEYAKAVIQDLLDNSDEYARQRAIDYLKENENK